MSGPPHSCRCVLIKDRRRTQAKRADDGADEEKNNNNYVATLVKRARAWVFEKSRAGGGGGLLVVNKWKTLAMAEVCREGREATGERQRPRSWLLRRTAGHRSSLHILPNG